jgi:hypothetical protein
MWALSVKPEQKLGTLAEKQMYYVLRLASAMCFIGHGIFGILTKPVWCHYFAVFGIGPARAYQLMPVVGTIDLLMGLLLLVYPMRAVFAWLVIWGLFTAVLRPLSGEPFAECLERAGNYGAPFCLLLLTAGRRLTAESDLTGTHGLTAGGSRINRDPDRRRQTNRDADRRRQTNRALRIFGALLLIGHGWLNLLAKKGLMDQYQHLGFTNTIMVAKVIGIWEITGALLILIKPAPVLVLILLAWKMASELFYPQHGFLEWVERGGSYGVLLALYFSEIMLSKRWSRLYTSGLNSIPPWGSTQEVK